MTCRSCSSVCPGSRCRGAQRRRCSPRTSTRRTRPSPRRRAPCSPRHGRTSVRAAMGPATAASTARWVSAEPVGAAGAEHDVGPRLGRCPPKTGPRGRRTPPSRSPPSHPGGHVRSVRFTTGPAPLMRLGSSARPYPGCGVGRLSDGRRSLRDPRGQERPWAMRRRADRRPSPPLSRQVFDSAERAVAPRAERRERKSFFALGVGSSTARSRRRRDPPWTSPRGPGTSSNFPAGTGRRRAARADRCTRPGGAAAGLNWRPNEDGTPAPPRTNNSTEDSDAHGAQPAGGARPRPARRRAQRAPGA